MLIRRVRFTSYNRWDPPRAIPSPTSFPFVLPRRRPLSPPKSQQKFSWPAQLAAATVVRNQRVAEFTTVVGIEAHAAAIASGATEEEAAQAAQTAEGAALTVAQAAIAEADATNSSA